MRFARRCCSRDGGIEGFDTMVVPLVCPRVSEEAAATTISENALGLTSTCCKPVARITSCTNYVHRYINVKRKHYKCKAMNELIKVALRVI